MSSPLSMRAFSVKLSDLGIRFDAKYFALREVSPTTAFPLRQLGALTRIEPDYGSGARAVTRTNQQEPRYIRITDFGDDGIPPGHEFTTPVPTEASYLLERDDLLFARSGATVGKTYLHEDVTEPAIFAG